ARSRRNETVRSCESDRPCRRTPPTGLPQPRAELAPLRPVRRPGAPHSALGYLTPKEFCIFCSRRWIRAKREDVGDYSIFGHHGFTTEDRFFTVCHRSAPVGSSRLYSRDVSYVDDARSQQYHVTPTTLSLRASTTCSTHRCISAAEGIRLTSGRGATKVWISGRNLVNVPVGAGGASCDRL